jgi:hypothetical protein
MERWFHADITQKKNPEEKDKETWRRRVASKYCNGLNLKKNHI